MKLLARALLGVSLAALVVLLFAPIYVEPGNGHISCGRAWAPSSVEEFLADDCHDAIASRRVQLATATAFALIAGVGLIFTYKVTRPRTARP